jgi:hypothetical protein
MAAGAASLAIAVVGRAQTTSVEVSIHCPLLRDEASALLEARARADLVSEALPEGVVAIACDAGGRAIVSWEPKGGARSERAVDLGRAADGAIDSILVALHDVLAEWEHARAASVAPPATPESAPTDAGAPAIPPATPSAPTTADAGASPPAAAIDASDTLDTEPSAQRSASRARLAATLGVDGEAWSGHVVGALGGYAGARLALGPRWHTSLLVGALRSLGDANGASAWGLRAAARVDYTLVGRLDVGLGISGRALWASTGPTTLAGTTAGGTAGLRYGIPVGATEVAVGGGVEALLRPVVVEVDGREEFRVPTWVGGVFGEVSYP